MSPVINEQLEREVIAQLDDYAENLRAEVPSAELNARMEATIAQWASERRAHSILRRPLAWVVAVASVAVITGGIVLLAVGESGGDTDSPTALAPSAPLPQLSARTAVSPLANGSQVSLFPAEGAVFRVKANLASAVVPTSGQMTNGERQYWVDVRIANDGTMRIMQVLPAERSRVVPRE
jgi:ABC-type transport system involved in cytochrome bd biosynthesis fused ATPase/permease subunit